MDTRHSETISQWVFKKTALFGTVREDAAIIQTEACGINFKDVLIALGRLERETSCIYFTSALLRLCFDFFLDMLGLEAAGTLVSLPPNASNNLNLKEGDKVMGFVVGGLASHSVGLLVCIVNI